tara:strand:- start:8809 stop:9093 length:285 start_codon:yes stop_codon:yes gene_type:complete
MDIGIVQIVASALGGGLISVVLAYLINKRKQGASEFELIIKERKAIADDLEERLDKLEVEIERLRQREIEQREEILSLRNQLAIFEIQHPKKGE